MMDQNLILEAAVGIAEKEATDAAVAETTRSIADSLETAKKKEARENISVDDLKRIRAEEDERMQLNGDYARIEADTLDTVRGQVRRELLEARQAELQTDPEQDRLRGIAIAELRAETDASLAQAERAEIDRLKEEFRRSRKGRKAIEAAREEAEEHWQDASEEEILREAGDAAARAIIDRRSAAIVARESRIQQTERLQAEFINGGIDTTKIAEGVKVEISLGRVHGSEDSVDEFDVLREMSLCSRGDGAFTVDSDRLIADQYPDTWYGGQHKPLAPGTIIHVGRKISDSGNEHLEPRISSGVPLCYDTDITDDPDEITDAIYPVGQISVGDIKLSGNFSTIIDFSGRKIYPNEPGNRSYSPHA